MALPELLGGAMDGANVRIFVDFWNFQLSLNEIAPRSYRLDWLKLAPWLTKRASDLTGQILRFDGAHVYISYDPRSDKDRNLRDWATTFLDRCPGVQVILRERRALRPPTCPSCHEPILTCPHCNAVMSRTVEKGIDTAIVTDLMKLAWEGAWQVAVLVSSDHDFIPAVELLAAKGYRVVNAHFPPKGMNLARKCWASIDLKEGLAELKRPSS